MPTKYKHRRDSEQSGSAPVEHNCDDDVGGQLDQATERHGGEAVAAHGGRRRRQAVVAEVVDEPDGRSSQRQGRDGRGW